MFQVSSILNLKMSLSKLLSTYKTLSENSSDSDTEKNVQQSFHKNNGSYTFSGLISLDDLENIRDDKITKLMFLNIKLVNTEMYIILNWMSMYNRCKNLTKLHIQGVRLPTNFFEMLHNYPKLTDVAVRDSNVSCYDLEGLRLNTTIRRLDLSGNRKLSYLSFLHLIPNLAYLDLSDTNIDNTSLQYISMLKKLQVLVLCDTHVSDVLIKYINNLKELRELDICNTCISNEGYQSLIPYIPNLYYHNDVF